MATKIRAFNLDSSADNHVRGLIDSSYITARAGAGTDSAAVIGLIDSDYVKGRGGIMSQNALKVPSFDSAGKASLTPSSGMIIYNTTANIMQYYANNEWKSIDSPPAISSITPSTFDATNDTITVNGSSFANGASITCIATNGSTFACTTTFVSSTRVTFVPTSAMVSDAGANDKFSIRITNPSGLASADLSEALDFSSTPTFTTSAGSLGSIYDVERVGKTFTIAATGADSDDTLSFAVTSGSLPANMSMSTSGVISGTPSQVSAGQSVTSTFTVTCTATSAEDNSITKTNTRQFSITVKGVIEQIFNYSTNAMQTWTPPADLTKATVAMWGGGGGSYAVSGGNYGNGGAGGFVESTINILPAERNASWKVVVAEGGYGNGRGGYGGGFGGANGGGGGGGASFLLAPSINLSADPFGSLTYGGSNGGYPPTSEFLGKTMATHVVLIAAGGGGAGWYVYNNRHGGAGGGIEGGNGVNSNGATQTAGGAGQGTGTSGTKFRGGQETANQSNGGSGGGGGGFYGGGVNYGGSGQNNGGGGGSSFIGFADGSTSTVLNANTSSDSYIDTSTRTNGTRTYTNSQTLRTGEATRTPYTSSAYYDTGSGVGTGYGARRGYTERGGHGFVSIRY